MRPSRVALYSYKLDGGCIVGGTFKEVKKINSNSSAIATREKIALFCFGSNGERRDRAGQQCAGRTDCFRDQCMYTEVTWNDLRRNL